MKTTESYPNAWTMKQPPFYTSGFISLSTALISPSHSDGPVFSPAEIHVTARQTCFPPARSAGGSGGLCPPQAPQRGGLVALPSRGTRPAGLGRRAAGEGLRALRRRRGLQPPPSTTDRAFCSGGKALPEGPPPPGQPTLGNRGGRPLVRGTLTASPGKGWFKPTVNTPCSCRYSRSPAPDGQPVGTAVSSRGAKSFVSLLQI